MKQVYSKVKVILKAKDNESKRIKVITKGYKDGLKYKPVVKNV